MTQTLTRRLLLAALGSGVAQAALAGAPVASLRPQERGGSATAPAMPEDPVEPETQTTEAETEITRPQERPEDLAKPASPEMTDLIKKAGLGGELSICVRDISTGQVLEAYEPDALLPPASVTKVVTSLYALEALGGAYRFETHLVGTGPLKEGVLDGDLLLIGGGDPLLDTNALAAMAEALKARGVSRITGKLLAWDGALPFVAVLDPGQPIEVAYNPTVSGLALNFNRVEFEWHRTNKGYALSMAATSDLYRPPVKVSRISSVNRKGPTYTYKDGGDSDIWTVAAPRLGKAGTRWLPARKPGIYSAEVLAYFLNEQGIEITNGAPLTTAPEGQVLVTHESEPLDEVLKGLLKYSNNLTAELCGLTATHARLGDVTELTASARAMTTWAQQSLGMTNSHFADHSGLHDETRISAGELSRALVNRAGSGLRPLLKTIPVRDGKYRVVKGDSLNIVAKTGTLFFTSALAGYVQDGSGRDMAFAILANNPKKREGYNSHDEESPPGAPAWNKRAKQLQQGLLQRWGTVYG